MATPAFDTVPASPPPAEVKPPPVVSAPPLIRCCASTGSCSYPSCKCDLPLTKTIQ